jgi:hypothetical protein
MDPTEFSAEERKFFDSRTTMEMHVYWLAKQCAAADEELSCMAVVRYSGFTVNKGTVSRVRDELHPLGFWPWKTSTNSVPIQFRSRTYRLEDHEWEKDELTRDQVLAKRVESMRWHAPEIKPADPEIPALELLRREWKIITKRWKQRLAEIYALGGTHAAGFNALYEVIEPVELEAAS